MVALAAAVAHLRDYLHHRAGEACRLAVGLLTVEDPAVLACLGAGGHACRVGPDVRLAHGDREPAVAAKDGVGVLGPLLGRAPAVQISDPTQIEVEQRDEVGAATADLLAQRCQQAR